MSKRVSDFASDEFSLPRSIEALGSTPATDGAAEAWIAAQAHGFIFDAWRNGIPVFLGTNCASVVSSGLLKVYERLAIGTIMTAVQKLTRLERMRWWKFWKRWSSLVWEGSLGELFTSWCEVVRETRADSPLGNTLHFLAPQTPETRHVFPVVVFTAMLRETITHGQVILHAKETLPIPQWRLEVRRQMH